MSNCMFDSDLEKFTRCRCRAQFGNLWMQHLTHLRRAEELSPVSVVEMGAIHIYRRCACKFVEFHVPNVPAAAAACLLLPSCCHVGCWLSLTLAVVELCTRSLLAANNRDDRKGAGMRTQRSIGVARSLRLISAKRYSRCLARGSVVRCAVIGMEFVGYAGDKKNQLVSDIWR